MKEHNWNLIGRGAHNGKQGEWHECSGCSKRVFFPDGWTDFQKRLTVAMAWMNDVEVLNKDVLHSRTIKNSKLNMDKGYHGILSEDCEEAQKFIAEYVMLM